MRKKKSKNRKIRVFLADDQPLVIEGWRRILERESDIQTLKRFSFSRDGQRMSKIYPDIVILRAEWLRRAENREMVKALKRTVPQIKTIAIAETKRDFGTARQHGASEALLAPIRRQDLVSLVRGLSRDAKSVCAYYVVQLDELVPGELNSDAFRELILNIFKFLFSRHFSHIPGSAPPIDGDKERNEIAFTLTGSSDFWSDIQSTYNVNYIPLFISNSSEVEPGSLQKLFSRLSGHWGSFGILITRNQINNVQMLQVSAYKNEGKVLLILSDKTIRLMLALKAAGVDPTEIFEDLYRELMYLVGSS